MIRKRFLILAAASIAVLSATRMRHSSKEEQASAEEQVASEESGVTSDAHLPDELASSEGKLSSYSPQREETLVAVIALLQPAPSDSDLVAFKKFSHDWLLARLSEIEDDGCERYVESKPELPLQSDQIDDSCGIDFERGFFTNALAANASPAGKRYLSLYDESRASRDDFSESAAVAVKADAWLREFGDAHVLAGNVREIYQLSFTKTFFGVSSTFMPRADEEGNFVPEALAAYERLAQEAPNSRPGRVAREILPMIEEADYKITPEIDERIEQLSNQK